jgi:hypothetical protein
MAGRPVPLPQALPAPFPNRSGSGSIAGFPGARDRCDTTVSTTGQVLMVVGWTLQGLARTFETLFVAGLTEAVRKT